jgi:hypothetical protein
MGRPAANRNMRRDNWTIVLPEPDFSALRKRRTVPDYGNADASTVNDEYLLLR